MPHRYVIVGAGPAGISAAEAIRGQDPDGEIVLISEELAGFYSRPGLAYYLANEIPERLLFPFTPGDFGRLRLRLLQARVVRLHPQEHHVELHEGNRLPYDRLLLATGSRAVWPDLPGVDLDGVVRLDMLDDAREMIQRSRRARAAVVVGGGITALEIVEGLRARRVRTYYFLRRDRYWSGVLDEAESRIVEHRLQEEGIRLYYHTSLAEILGKRGRVSGVLTEDGQQIPCQIVAIAIGVRPHQGLALEAGLKADRGILVNEFLQTSAPDIFAAGDVAQVLDPVSGKTVLDTLWSVALAQGRAAGLNMAGRPAPYHKAVPLNVTRLAGLTTTIIGTVGRGDDLDLLGIARGDSESWRQLPDALAAQSHFEVNRLRLLIKDRTLIGAIVMGNQALSRPLYQLVASRADLASIRDRLLQPGAPLADLVSDFWIEWRKEHETAQR